MKQSYKHLIGSMARTLLGLTFIFSGFVKAIDPLGTTYKIEDYFKAFGGFFNSLIPTAEFLAFCLIAFEFVLGVCLLCNVATKWTSWLALLMMVVMTPITLYLAIANPISDCGCFGDAVVLSNWATFWKNVVLTALVIVLLVFKDSIPSTFLPWMEWVIAGLALLFVIAWMVITLRHLPLIDFRPYKIGNNIEELMQYPDDAEPDQYLTTFIYEKDGKQKEFDLTNYPKGDSTWTFVDQHTVLVKKGYEPPIHDFEIMTEDFTDLTDDVLQQPQAVMVVMYDLKKTTTTLMPRLQHFVEQCAEASVPVYMLTGSTFDDIEQFVNTYFASSNLDFYQNFYTCDPVTLKTIVRANPGVVVLNHGVITDKFNLRNRATVPAPLEVDLDEKSSSDEYYISDEYTDDNVYTEEQDFSAEVE